MRIVFIRKKDILCCVVFRIQEYYIKTKKQYGIQTLTSNLCWRNQFEIVLESFYWIKSNVCLLETCIKLSGKLLEKELVCKSLKRYNAVIKIQKPRCTVSFSISQNNFTLQILLSFHFPNPGTSRKSPQFPASTRRFSRKSLQLSPQFSRKSLQLFPQLSHNFPTTFPQIPASISEEKFRDFPGSTFFLWNVNVECWKYIL